MEYLWETPGHVLVWLAQLMPSSDQSQPCMSPASLHLGAMVVHKLIQKRAIPQAQSMADVLAS